MDPRFERDVFVKNVIKHKPNYSVAPTSMYEGFLEEKLVKNSDLSHFKYPFEGGEPLIREVSDKIEAVFRKHNNKSKLLVGYGQCECGATITSETMKTTHIDGTVGIPLPGLNMAIVDDDLNSLPYNTRGQILVDTPCGMMYYYNNENATNSYFFHDSAGTKWFCTGDVGYVDKDGNLFIEGRSSDYSIVNGKKIYNFDVENVIARNKKVKLCDVITNNGQLAAHIVLEKSCLTSDFDIEEFERELQQEIYDVYEDKDYIPTLFKIRESFPYAKSGKRNVLEMLKETEGFVELKPNFVNEKKLLQQ
jgi:long-chain acyl-CoA synthetase